MMNLKTRDGYNPAMLNTKSASSALCFSLALLLLMCGPAFCSEKPGTIDEIAAAHQDAVLSLKAFRFSSTISCATDTAHAISASGTFNSGDWSAYEASIRLDANSTASLKIEYFSKDDFYFRDFAISHPSFPPSADTTEGWDDAPPEVFRREIPLDPMRISAAFIGNETAVIETGARTFADGSKCAVYVSSEPDSEGNPIVTFCVDDETGLIREAEVTSLFVSNETDINQPPACSATLTIEPIAEPVAISPPEKVVKLYEDAAKKKAEEEKANSKKKKKKFF